MAFDCIFNEQGIFNFIYYFPRAGVYIYATDVCYRRLGTLEGKKLSIIWLHIDYYDHPIPTRAYTSLVAGIAKSTVL